MKTLKVFLKNAVDGIILVRIGINGILIRLRPMQMVAN